MDHHRACSWFLYVTVIRPAIPELETLGQLEVELDCRALVCAPKRVADLDVNLGAIERAVSWIFLPLSGLEFVECITQLLKSRFWCW